MTAGGGKGPGKGQGGAGGAGGTSGKGGGARQLKVRVKGGRTRSSSSARWLTRQLNDPFVAAARREGWRSRAAFKLTEIADAHGLFRRGQRILDLGCAPGGWLQVAVARTGATASGEGSARVVGIDLLPVDPVPGATVVEGDFLDPDAPDRLRVLLGGPADGVLSDMAANATGHRKTDHLKIMALAEAAAEFAREILAPGGFFLAKVLQGGTEGELLASLKRDFATVRHLKPAASRADSAELYVLATGFRGRKAEPGEGSDADA